MPLLVLVLVAAGTLTACRPLYIPAIPDDIPFTPRVSASTDGGFHFDAAGYPTIELELRDVAEPGWLAVQWFSPQGSEAASQSVWVEAAAQQSVSFTLPADVALRRGDWRAVLSLNGRLVRQLNFTMAGPD